MIPSSPSGIIRGLSSGAGGVAHEEMNKIAGKVEFILQDATGKVILHENILCNSNHFSIPLHNTESGLYFYSVRTDQQTLNGKVMVR